MTKYLTIPAVVAGALGMGSTIAWAAEPTTAELLEQIKSLQGKVEQLESKSGPTSAQVDATVDSVLKDAERRSQLMAMDGFTGGHDGKHFGIGSADKKYWLSPRFQFQFRHATNWADDGKNSGDSATDSGFEIRRMKFEFVGNAISEDLTYNFRWATDRSGGTPVLENAFIAYKFNDQMAFQVGQFKDDVWHEENVSSGKQLAAERSLVNEVMAGGITDYVQGARLIFDSKDSPFMGTLTFHDGANTDNTNYQDGGGVGSLNVAPANFGVSGRVEWAANNNRKGYDDFTARGNKDDLLVIGGGFDWSQGGDNNVFFHTVDVQWEPQSVAGLGVYAAYIGQWLQLDDPAFDDDFYNFGVVVQAGYMFNDKTEGFVRGGYWSLDEDLVTTGEDDGFEITVGGNYYFADHNAKVTLDLTWLPDGSPSSVSGANVIASDDTQVIFRGQFQLWI